jgi:hypothetical protein
MARDRAIRKFLQEKSGSQCGRCFRASCMGKSGEGKGAACAVLGSSGFVPTAWTHALKSILMWLMVDRETYGKLIETFYANSGTNFGSWENVVRNQLNESTDKDSVSSYYSCSQVSPSLRTHRISCFPVIPTQRCLASLPDLGNPAMLAGLCWWLDYGPLLEKKGLLKYVRNAHSNERMDFGDGPSAAPLFVLIQVPLWYKRKNGSTILVFANTG